MTLSGFCDVARFFAGAIHFGVARRAHVGRLGLLGRIPTASSRKTECQIKSERSRARIKKGIVRDPAVHDAVCADIAAVAATLGGTGIAVIPSPIDGADGNREFFLGARFG